jgi:hypothetical protein
MTPKDAKTKRTFHGVFRHFRTFKVPTKADGGQHSKIWTQWTWKQSRSSIGYNGDENGQSRQVKHFLINLYLVFLQRQSSTEPILKKYGRLSAARDLHSAF